LDDELELKTAPKALKRFIIFVVVALAGVTASFFTPLGEYFSRDAISRLAKDLGWGGPAVILGAGLLSPLLFLPRWPIALVSGLLYGVLWGTLLSNVASTLGAWLHFVLAQSLLSPTADRLREKYNLTRLRVPREKAFTVLFILRAFPLSNFVATNLLAGALKIHFGTYLAATFLGMIPSSLMYAAWGKLLKKPSSWFFVVAAFTLFMVVLGTLVARKKLLPYFKEMGTREKDGEGNTPPA